MKKFLAIMMSVIMAFTLVAFPASAAVAEEDTTATAAPEISIGDVIDSFVVTVELVQATLLEVHNIVGTIMGMLEKECPMCGVMHEFDLGGAEDGEVEDGEVEGDGEATLPEIGEGEDDAETEGDAETFLPEIGEDMTEDEKEVAAILMEILILTGQLVSSVK